MDRFWDKVKKAGPDDCWEWQAGLNNKGYGSFRFEGKIHTAHRFSYLLNVGEIPEGHVVRHKCDNRCCVNPAHLETGTCSQNNQDMVNRGRRRTRYTSATAAITTRKTSNRDGRGLPPTTPTSRL